MWDNVSNQPDKIYNKGLDFGDVFMLKMLHMRPLKLI